MAAPHLTSPLPGDFVSWPETGELPSGLRRLESAGSKGKESKGAEVLNIAHTFRKKYRSKSTIWYYTALSISTRLYDAMAFFLVTESISKPTPPGSNGSKWFVLMDTWQRPSNPRGRAHTSYRFRTVEGAEIADRNSLKSVQRGSKSCWLNWLKILQYTYQYMIIVIFFAAQMSCELLVSSHSCHLFSGENCGVMSPHAALPCGYCG